MKLPELPTVPMLEIAWADRVLPRNVLSLAHALEMTLAEAAISLNLFEAARTELAAMAPPGWYRDEPDVDASLEPVRRALAARAPRPKIYYDAAPHLHARTFVLSLRMIGLYLEKIAEEAASVLPELKRIAQAYEASFPGLKDLRDSITHAEDRLRHLDRKGKTIVPQDVPGLTEGGGVFIAGLLNGRALGWTLGDGSYAECEVSERSLALGIRYTQDLMAELASPQAQAVPGS